MHRMIVLALCALLAAACAFGARASGARAAPRPEAGSGRAAEDGGISQPAAPATGGPEAGASPPPRARRTVAELRQQGIKPAVLLAGDLLLSIVALVMVLIARRKRPS